MNRFERSWLLLRSSLSIIFRNKQLLVFPIAVFICTTMIVGFFLLPPIFRPTGHPYTSAAHWQAISHSLFTDSAGADGQHTGFTPAAMIYLAFLYFLSMFIATFCNVAFYHEILAALGGQEVSIGRGFRFACSRLGSILMWTFFAGLIGLLIKQIEQRFQIIGQIIGRLIGIAWSIAAVFAIPVLVREEQNANPIAVLRKSAGLLKRTWGEALIGYAGLTMANGVILLGSLAVLAGAFFISMALHNFWVLAFVGAAWLLSLFAWSYLIGVASQVYRGALYLYAAEGTIPEPYDRDLLDMAWKFKKS
jgi:hypothetical protein